MVAATGICKIVVKHSRGTIPESYPHIRHSAQYAGISLLHDHSKSPLRISKVDYLITCLQIKSPRLFLHNKTHPAPTFKTLILKDLKVKRRGTKGKWIQNSNSRIRVITGLGNCSLNP